MRNPASVKHGDVVSLRGDASLWLVMDVHPADPRFSIVIPRSSASRRVKPSEIDKHWRLAGRPKRGGTKK